MGGSTEHGKTRHGEDIYLRAEGLLTGEPAWSFERTATVKLDGSHRLVMIARAPRGTRARLSVTLSASVKTGRLPGPFKRTTQLHGAPGPTIELEF